MRPARRRGADLERGGAIGAPRRTSRRLFLGSSAAALGGVLGSARSAASAPSPPAAAGRALAAAEPPAPSWIDRPMRWAQLTLVEDDPVRFDIDFWLDYFRRTRSDAVCLSAGGCVAYYPTRIPFHHRSAWLGERDVFGELVAGCRRLGMVVIARTDPHATYDDVQAAHPDWIAVDATGSPRRHWASPEMWVTCGLGPYNFEFMTEVTKEIVARYRVDGIFINRWTGSGMCYCRHCALGFRAATGRELPRLATPEASSGQPDYLLWRQQRVFDLWQLWDAEVRRINPDACVIPNTGGGATSRLDMDKVGERAAMMVADRQARSGLMAPWAIGMNAKEYRAALGRKPVVGLFGVGVEEAYRWKDSVQNPDEIRLWVADLVANGMRPWYSKFAGALHDERWLRPVEELYRWCADVEPYLRNERPLARVGLVYSQQTAWFHGGEQARARVEDPGRGWYQALVESRIPFEMVHDRRLDAPSLAPLRTLILPNVACLSDAQCDELRAFVRGGGGLVATWETSLWDERGGERRDFGLADLFGASFVRRVPGPVRNGYLRLEHGTAAGPLLSGLEDAPRIIHGAWLLDVKPRAPFPNPPVTRIPAYPDLPMEKVYVRQPKTDIPEVLLRDVGEGRVAYFPWDVDRTFWEVLAPDHLKLMRNAVAWATREEPPAVVTGPGVLDVTVWRQRDSLTVHLVNLTNPMMMKGPVRELLPVGAQAVRVRLPEGRRPRSVRLLVGGAAPETSEAAGWLSLRVPEILAHEVVAIDL